tara:strand:- start:1838 stop:2092 length:255 start_codon:yes stop_codon:yes gene_type:complete
MDITVTITDTEYKGLQSVSADPHEWIQHAATNRARIAIDEIVRIYTVRALDEGVQIPGSQEEIVEDAFDRAWVTALSSEPIIPQ